ncbi:hypothetical protein CK203_097594 [Vitis vinifera]|uniref:Uncharacterized protein n=1 Tax=Vitis vinifera TaxID=29760 RepID=A0A438CKM4_VITVI|nr:hypothetical protein CK203_097594 [Vitis vinifera]
MASLGSLLCASGSPAVPAPPELPRDEQLPQAQQDEILTDTTLLPLQHTPLCICLRLYILLLLSPQAAPPVMQLPQYLLLHLSLLSPFLLRIQRPSASLQTLEHCSGFYYPPDGHYSAHQDQIIATQAQHTTILHQIQQHLSMQTPPWA